MIKDRLEWIIYHYAILARYVKSFIYFFGWPITLIVIYLILSNTFDLKFLNQNTAQMTLIITTLGFGYFIHNQRMNETKYLLEKFNEYNSRYDVLNGKLNILYSSDSFENCIKTNPDFNEALSDYFNLCAEEYLLFKKGFIPNDVWASWKSGMAHFFKQDHILEIFKNEDTDNQRSYYGFSPQIVLSGVK